MAGTDDGLGGRACLIIRPCYASCVQSRHYGPAGGHTALTASELLKLRVDT